MERLNKIIANTGICSRRAADQLILEGKVRVNGRIVTELGIKADPNCDKISIGKKTLTLKPTKVYILFNKPTNVLVTKKDPQGRQTVMDFIKLRGVNVNPVGRLDFKSSGLLLLTNDGDFANKITHPKYNIEKRYLVKLQGIPEVKIITRIKQGIAIDGKMARVGQLRFKSRTKHNAWLEIIIYEGRKHIIRKIFERFNLHVLKLQRIGLGNLKLGNLKPGQFRLLTSSELIKFK